MNLLEQVKEAGIVGAGGAGFPTHVKLQSKAEYLLMNGAECEPLLRVDQQIMDVYADEILLGFNETAKFVEAKHGIIGIKIKHKKLIEKLESRIAELGIGDLIEVKAIKDVYPAGDEHVLVYELTGRVVPELGIPMEVGCIVVNSETTLNVYNAMKGQPVIKKYITVVGDIPKPTTVCVPVGTPLMDVLKLSGISDFTGYRVVDGGPMMGPLLDDLDGFVTKKTKGLVILKDDHNIVKKKMVTMESARLVSKTACEQCRMCTDMCPRYLLGHNISPHKMVRALNYSLNDNSQLTIAQLCCHCNLCEYFVCPADINPKMANTYFINKLRAEGVKHVRTSETSTPHEMREFRLVPSRRLIARIGLIKFDVAAPLTLDEVVNPQCVHIMTNANVGAPSVPNVKVGDFVEVGQKIGDIKEGALGATIHASISGKITEITDSYVEIRRD